MTNAVSHDCTDELHRADLRATPARLGVLSVLEHTSLPVDVSTLTHNLKRRKIAADPVTVFRILNTFAKKGLVRAVRLNEGKARYEYAGNPMHHHFVCESCGSIADVADCAVEAMEQRIEKTYGVTVTRHALEFFGVCGRCSA